jgi:oligopeptide transport system substrate-binding protein
MIYSPVSTHGIEEVEMKRTILPIAMALALMAGVAGAQDFILNNGSEPQSFDPSLIQGVPEHRIFLALFEGLVVNDPKTSKAVPGVAESWVVTPDGLKITFKLRKCAWSDGTAITSKDFVEGWLRTLDPATASEYAYMIGTVVKGADEYNKGKGPREGVGIKAVGDLGFEVTLKGPAAYAVDMMSHYAFSPLPMHALAKYGDEWVRPGKFVGNGPFTLKEWRPQEYVLVEKNPKYWDAKSVKLKTIKFLPIEDNRTAYNMFKNKEIDWATTVPNDLIDEVKLRKDYQVGPQFSTYYMLYNVTRKPLDDVRVRKALAMAIDKKGLVDRITKGGQLVADTVIPPNAGFVSPKGASYNPEEARKLLAAAGYPDGKGFPAMTVIYNTSDNHKKIMEYVQAEWKKNLGIEFSLRNLEWTTFLDARSNLHDG